MNPIEILLIEDNPADAKLTQEALRVASVPNRLTVVSDGVEALVFLRQEGPYANAQIPDLIMMDMNLPRLGGFELLAELQADRRFQQIPIVVLTGSIDLDEYAELKKRPIRRCITKPSDIDEYFTAVQSVLEELHPGS